MEIQQLLIGPFLIVFAIGMLITTILSYLRSKNTKLIFVSIIFTIFFIRGLIIVFDTFIEIDMKFLSNTTFGLFDLIILFMLFFATLKR